MGRVRILLVGIAGVGVFMAGCGTLNMCSINEQLTNAHLALQAAETAGAKTMALVELQHAQDTLAIAKEAYTGRNFKRVLEFAKKSLLHAKLAQARSEQKYAEKKLAELKEEIKSREDTSSSFRFSTGRESEEP